MRPPARGSSWHRIPRRSSGPRLSTRPTRKREPCRASGPTISATCWRPSGTRRSSAESSSGKTMDSKVVVITGASSGIGAATAELLARQGMSVALLARRRDRLEAVAAACGERALALVTDVTQRDEVRRAVDATIARFGHIDVWINNAGQGITRQPSALTDED